MLAFVKSIFGNDTQETQRLLNLVAEKTDNAVIITNAEGRILWSNEGFERISGYTLEEVKGKKPGHVLQGPDTDPDTVQRIRQQLTKGQSFTEEILNYHKDGSAYWLSLHITPVRNDAGELTHFIAFELDVTERRQREAERQAILHEMQQKNEELQAQSEEIRQAQEELQAINEELNRRNQEIADRESHLRRLSLVAERTDNAVIVTSALGEIQWINEGFTRISGYTLADVIGQKPGHVLQGPDTDPQTVERIRRQLLSKKPFTEEILNYHKDGTPYWLSLHISPVLNAAGDVEQFVAIELDITERKSQEAARQQLMHELQQKNEELASQAEEIRQTQEELQAINEDLVRRNEESQRLNKTLAEREAKVRQLALVAARTDNAVIIASKDGQIEWVNPGFTNISGYTFDEVIGRKPGAFLQGPDTDPATVERIRQGLRSRRPFKEEILNYHKDGRPYWLSLSITPILDDLGEIEKFIAIELDITEQKQRDLELEHQAREIQAGLDYASRIQRAILPVTAPLERYSEDFCLLYMPKETLSGDFYWLHETEGYLYFAVADATGHGVPGALMSMLGSTLLSQIIQEPKFHSPELILTELNYRLRETLTQEDGKVRLNDGMDISVLRINREMTELCFAGANHNLTLYRAGEELEYKGDRQAISAQQFDTSKPFDSYTLHTLALQPGDTVYAMTDGLADQFGGEQGRKLTRRKLLDFLRSMQETPMERQRTHLRDLAHRWRGDREQTDDILLLGLRF